jgi:hypothetical protein
MATAATAVVWPLGERKMSGSQPADERLEDQVGGSGRGDGADDGEQHPRPTPGEGGRTGYRSDEKRYLYRIPEIGQDAGDGLIPAEPAPDQSIQVAVQMSRHVLIGKAHPENGDHDDRHHDDGKGRSPHALCQQRPVAVRIRDHESYRIARKGSRSTGTTDAQDRS